MILKSTHTFEGDNTVLMQLVAKNRLSIPNHLAKWMPWE
jgi:hypothetical protein